MDGGATMIQHAFVNAFNTEVLAWWAAPADVTSTNTTVVLQVGTEAAFTSLLVPVGSATQAQEELRFALGVERNNTLTVTYRSGGANITYESKDLGQSWQLW